MLQNNPHTPASAGRTPDLSYAIEERARQDSNLRLLPPEGSALSTELRAPAAHHRSRAGTGASASSVTYAAR